MSDTLGILLAWGLVLHGAWRCMDVLREWDKQCAEQRPYISPRRVRRLIELVDELEKR